MTGATPPPAGDTRTRGREAEALGLTGDAYLSHALTGMNWVVLGALLLFAFGRKKGKGFRHPPTDDDSDLPLGHRIAGIACVVIFAVTFTPIPIRMTF